MSNITAPINLTNLPSTGMKNIFSALAKFQAECPDLYKDSEGYGGQYKYIELPHMLKIVVPILRKHNLVISQICDGQNVNTILCHFESGETLNSSIEIPQGVQLAKMNTFQVLGSAISYLRRYQIEMILGISATKDTDAAGEQTSAPQPTKSQNEGMGDAPEKWLNALTKEGAYTELGQKTLDAIASGKRTIADVKKAFKVSKADMAELQKAEAIFSSSQNSNRP